jgi:hypothetical protein
MASVEMVGNYVALTLDESGYCFTALQYAEVFKKLSKMLLIFSGLGMCKASATSAL